MFKLKWLYTEYHNLTQIDMSDLLYDGQSHWPVVAADDHGLTAGTTGGHSEFMFIVLVTVVKLLQDTVVTPVHHDAFVTAGRDHTVGGPGQGIGRGRVDTDLTLHNNRQSK